MKMRDGHLPKLPSIYKPLLEDAHRGGITIEQRRRHITFTHPKIGVIGILPYRPNESGCGHKKVHSAIRRAIRKLAET